MAVGQSGQDIVPDPGADEVQAKGDQGHQVTPHKQRTPSDHTLAMITALGTLIIVAGTVILVAIAL